MRIDRLGTVIALAVAATLPTTPAIAKPSGEATIQKDANCKMRLETEEGEMVAITSDRKVRVQPGAGGFALICHFKVPDELVPEKQTSRSGMQCNTAIGSTTNSKLVITPGGRATLTCHANGQDRE